MSRPPRRSPTSTLSLCGPTPTGLKPPSKSALAISVRISNPLPPLFNPNLTSLFSGICGIDADGTRCQAATGRSVETLASALFPSPQNTSSPTNNNSNNSNSNSTAAPLNRAQVTDLISTALDLQSSTFTPVLAAAGVLFVLSLAALFVLKRDVQSPSSWERPRRSALVRRVTYGLLFGSTALVFAAALATSQAAGALEYASKGMSHASVLIKAGTTMQVLQWVAFGFEVLFAGAVPFLVRYKAPAEEEYKGEA